jgi:hypothetical protein
MELSINGVGIGLRIAPEDAGTASQWIGGSEGRG